MKQTQASSSFDSNDILNILVAKNLIEEKTRINLYLPKIVVKLIDSLSKNSSRGKLITSLVVEKIQKTHKLPFGLFSPLEISEEEIGQITSSLDNTIDELA